MGHRQMNGHELGSLWELSASSIGVDLMTLDIINGARLALRGPPQKRLLPT
jgi:hypothetical protein